MSERRIRMIIDTDCGVDDASAIMLALSPSLKDTVEVLAITCVDGNTTVDNSCLNVLQVLQHCERTDVPVYRGAEFPLLGDRLEATHFHGVDGFGDTDIPKPDKSLVKSGHAVEILVKHVTESPGEVTLVCLGPLTNIALACRLDPTFSSKVRDVYIMGGNIKGIGNHTAAAEFNFLCDPEAAYIILHEMKCPITLVPWEFCIEPKHLLSWLDFDKYISADTKRSKLMRKATYIMYQRVQDESAGFCTADPFPMAVALCPEIVTKQQEHYASVELQGAVTRGQMIVDYLEHLKKIPNVKIVLDIDMEKFTSMFLDSVL